MSKRLIFNGTGTVGNVPAVKLQVNYDPVAAPSSSLAQDWTTRSTYTGVAWAHDYANSAEVFNFVDSRSPDGNTSSLIYNNVYSHEPTGGITSGAMTLTFFGNPICTIATMANVNGTSSRVTTTTAHQCSVGDVVLFGFNGQTLLPAPWTGFNESIGGGGGLTEGYTITVVNSTTSFDISNTPTTGSAINTTGFATYNGASGSQVQRRKIANGSWLRPFSALGSGNGLASPDRGVTAEGMPARTWDPVAQLNRMYNWRHDFYGHANYASRLAVWPNSAGQNVQTNEYRGADYWVQFAVKIQLASVQDSTAALRNPQPVKLIGANVMWTTPNSEVILYDNNTRRSPYAVAKASDGGLITGYTGAGNTHAFEKPNQFAADGGDYSATCVGSPFPNEPTNPAACWRWPHDEWTWFLLHVIPGVHVPNWGSWPTAPAVPTDSTGLQLWACSETRINSMRAQGLPVTYERVWDTIGANGWPFVYENFNPASFDNNGAAPAFNSLWITSYQNALPMIFGFQRKFTQVIFKKGNGANNPYTDGIPCPQVAPNFTTLFPATENPISESSKWVNGGSVGGQWNNVQTTVGKAFAAVNVPDADTYADPIAHISTSYRTFAANQFAMGRVFKASGYAPPINHEIELLLRFSITAGVARGYEVFWALGVPGTGPTEGRIVVVRWNGAKSDYTELSRNNNVGVANDGDVLRAEISGNLISVYKNGTLVTLTYSNGSLNGQSTTATDVSTFGAPLWTNGQPGMGFWPKVGATPSSYGWKKYWAGDL